MEETLTVAQIAERFGRDRSTVLRWIGRKLFPNAELKTTSLISYWVVPVSDVDNFKLPKPGPQKQLK